MTEAKPRSLKLSIASGRDTSSLSRRKVKRCWADARPCREIETALSGDCEAARTMSRKGAIYPLRQSRVCSMRAAIAGSTARMESAKTARPVADVLRRPSPPRGKHTPSASGERGFGTRPEYSALLPRTFRQDHPGQDECTTDELNDGQGLRENEPRDKDRE